MTLPPVRRPAVLAGLALTGAMLLASCSQGSRTPGVQLRLTLTPQPVNHAPQVAGAKQITNTEGTVIQLDRAYLTLWSVQLQTDCDQPGFVRNRSWVPRLDWLISSAHAHTDASPTLLGTPTVINLLAADGMPQEWGLLTPPAGTYCGATWQVLAADADAQSLPADTDMVGLSLALEGTYGPDSTPFRVASSRALTPARRRFSVPLTLDAAHRQATAQLDIPYDRWFDGLDLDALAQGDDTATTQLLQTISQTLTAAVDTTP